MATIVVGLKSLAMVVDFGFSLVLSVHPQLKNKLLSFLRPWLTSGLIYLIFYWKKTFFWFNLYSEKARFLKRLFLDHCAWIKSDNTSIDERIPDIVTVVFDKYFKSDSTFPKLFFDIFWNWKKGKINAIQHLFWMCSKYS